jgi:hypothetical protein
LLHVPSRIATRVDYPAWAWNVASAHQHQPALTIQFERPRDFFACSLDPETGKVERGESISGPETLGATQPPHLVADDAIWFAHGGPGHTLVAARYDRMTGLTADVSKISPTDFFLLGPDRVVYLHRFEVGLIKPHPLDQPELVVSYRKIGCRDPRGAAFDDKGRLWVLDEAGPALFELDLDRKNVRVHQLEELHREANDPDDPSPYPWHSCAWCGGHLVVGACDAARLDILRPLPESG